MRILNRFFHLLLNFAAPPVRQRRPANDLLNDHLALSRLVQNSGDLIGISDKNGIIQFVNKAGRVDQCLKREV